MLDEGMIRVLDRQKGTVGDSTVLLGTACNLKITDCLGLKSLYNHFWAVVGDK